MLAEEIIKSEMSAGDQIEIILDKENNLLKANIIKASASLPAPPKPRKKKEESKE